jgi:RHS repeat-associated protein
MWDAMTGGNQIQSVALEQSGGAPTNRIESVTSGGATENYSYDAAGNVTNDGVHGYTYDAENRLVSVDGGGTGQYSYDHQNRRYKKVVGSAVTDYVWEGSQVLAEHNGSTGGVITDYVYRGNRMIAKVEEGVTSYFLSDRLSVRLMVDASGNVIGRQGHLPYGEDFAESGSQEKHHFTNYERDGEAGGDYALNRYCIGAVGRFNSVDGVPGSTEVPSTLNRYSYTRNDPVNLSDPSGLDPVSFCYYNIPEDYTKYLDYYVVPVFEGCITIDVPTGPVPAPKEPPKPCDAHLPSNANIRAAVATVLGEGTPEARLGEPTYRAGDRPNHGTGETTITADDLLQEAIMIVSTLANRANNSGRSWEEEAKRKGQFKGYKTGKDIVDKGRFGEEGGDLCQKVKRALAAAGVVVISGPQGPYLFFVAVMQGERHPRAREQGDADRFADTDFSETSFGR